MAFEVQSFASPPAAAYDRLEAIADPWGPSILVARWAALDPSRSSASVRVGQPIGLMRPIGQTTASVCSDDRVGVAAGKMCNSLRVRVQMRQLLHRQRRAIEGDLKANHANVEVIDPALLFLHQPGHGAVQSRSHKLGYCSVIQGPCVWHGPRGHQSRHCCARWCRLRADQRNQLAAVAAIHREVAVEGEQLTGIDQLAEPD